VSIASRNIPEKEFTLKDFVIFLDVNRNWLAIGCLIGLVLGGIFGLTQTPMYTATSTLQISDANKKTSTTAMPDMFNLNQSSGPEVAIPILKSRSLAEDVVKNLALNADLKNVSDVSLVKTIKRRIIRSINPPLSLEYMGWSGKARYYLAQMIGDPGPIGSLVLRDLVVDSQLRNYELLLSISLDSNLIKISDVNGHNLAQCELGKVCLVSFSGKHISFEPVAINAGYSSLIRMSFRSLEAAAAVVRSGVDVEPLDKTSKVFLSLSYTGTDPIQAALILKVLTNSYDARDRQISTRSYDQMIDFLDKSMPPAINALEQAERNLRAFLDKRNMFDMQLQYEQGAKNITGYDQQQLDAELEKHQLVYLNNLLSKAEPNSYGALVSSISPNLAEEWKQLQEKTVQLDLEAQALAGYTNEYPSKKKNQIALKFVEEQKAELKKKAIQVVRDKQSMLVEKGRILDQASIKVQKNLGLDAETRIEFMRLNQNKAVAEKMLGMMQTKREEMRLTKAGEITGMQVLDSALPGYQVSPNIPKSLGLGGLIGLALTALMMFVREKLDDRIKDPSEIEKMTGLYVHGMIPVHKEATGNEGLVTIVRATSIEAEAYRSLRTSIQLASLENQITSIMITSAGPGEGKSTTMSNLAVTLAQSGRKTLVVDCDMRRPTINKVFDVKRDPGLSEILSNKTDWRLSVQPSAVENLYILASGSIPANPSELIGLVYMQTILAEMKQEYDFVLCDVPPILVVSDAALLAKYLDGVLILMRSGHAIAQDVARAREQMERVGGKVLGGIFNGYEATSGRYGYSRYGYSRYGYSRYGYSSNDGQNSQPITLWESAQSLVATLFAKILNKKSS
jgi:tyrosine-protein kinase Etk/Wzc